MLEPAIRELATAGTNFATVCVTLPSGEIASHVMWIDADDDHIVFNTETHRAKFRALEQNPRVTVTIIKADNPYAYAEVRGRVAETITGDEARAHIDVLSQRYFGKPYDNPITSERVIVKVAPDRQRAVGL
jgi:PPOX class probable F420-dependent enzyme